MSAQDQTPVDRVDAITDRCRVRLDGYVSSLVIPPRGVAPVVEADLQDGTGIITLIWMGRDRITGIEPGTRMTVSGLAALRGGHRVMYNPRYEIHHVEGEDSA